MSILTSIFGDANQRFIKDLAPIVEKINSLEPELQKLSAEQLKDKTREFKERLAKQETLDDLLPEAFAVVREAARRTLNQRHFSSQLIGCMVLHQGKIAQMRTGEEALRQSLRGRNRIELTYAAGKLDARVVIERVAAVLLLVEPVGLREAVEILEA